MGTVPTKQTEQISPSSKKVEIVQLVEEKNLSQNEITKSFESTVSKIEKTRMQFSPKQKTPKPHS